jgi:AraC family transcriptional regulator, transcriptional activator FtrA
VSHRVAVLAREGSAPFELSIAVEILGLDRTPSGLPGYDLVVCAEQPGPLRQTGGFTLQTDHGLEEFRHADTVVVPAGDTRGDPSPALAGALRDAHAAGARVVSLCTGSFTLAGAGLLDGREAATHWMYADLLAARFPRVRVNPDVLWVESDGVFTSAGSAAGIDLCLHLVRTDYGAAVANSYARRMVVPPYRDGGQAQFIERPMPLGAGDAAVHELIAWLGENLHRPLDLAAMAARIHVSERTLIRRFREATGTSPAQWLLAQRVAASLAMLEGSREPVEAVAAAVGFPSAASFRHHFARIMRTSPTAYRRTFAGAPGPDEPGRMRELRPRRAPEPSELAQAG